jgi:hypothetical protein
MTIRQYALRLTNQKNAIALPALGEAKFFIIPNQRVCADTIARRCVFEGACHRDTVEPIKRHLNSIRAATMRHRLKRIVIAAEIIGSLRRWCER